MKSPTRDRTRALFSPALFVAVLLVLSSAFAWAEKASQELDEGVSLVASYLVQNGEFVPNPDFEAEAEGEEAEDYETVRDYIWAIVPDPIKDMIGRFDLTEADPENDESSDGSVGLSEDDAHWEYALDFGLGASAVLDEVEEDYLAFDQVIIHELAHIIALNATQMGGGGTYIVEEGSLKKGAYLDSFYQKFWKKQYPDWVDTGEDDPDAAAELYESHPTAFITDYAATSPNEDLAESFASFVTEPKPAGKDEKAQKVLFFYAYPELVAYRDAMRKAMGSSK
ncbi:MAG: hypothetical protein Q8M76_03080 [Spirochaetaceae bacterium]|nr:hypothetical protein [Spirochaetaceae bacterium]